MEILVVMLVGGMIMAAGLLTMYQVIWGTARTNDQVRALTDANVAAMWLRQDLQMAQDTSLVDGANPASTLTITWTDFTGWAGETSDHSITYARNGNNLIRTYDGSDRSAGRNITAIGFTQNGNFVNATITATGTGISGRTETLGSKVYVHLRPD